ncbi:hypothetical protein P153DRAFT_371437 [Dothidotthia symphoricarpi CBS 119687]|uniref:Uncharacterized protein n=1 Tax=Dothidotthia symphoricarpi CBS 119687 TaxID=1392245 RepID=A0A6A5ZXX5_9PLEO|nr:uncharacterized protein P153DRAFT_371437 [Dothidotthia symphoricarpi CBS 119687]KAF2123754.1 hypothetical protein P153DRAFT_371437 [Dothidotthia symphoricarpi CBS 119687]
MEAVFEDHDGDSLYHARVPVAAGESFYTVSQLPQSAPKYHAADNNQADSSTTRVVSLKQVAEETTATPLIVSARASIETFATGDTLDLSADGSSSWNEDMVSSRAIPRRTCGNRGAELPTRSLAFTSRP